MVPFNHQHFCKASQILNEQNHSLRHADDFAPPAAKTQWLAVFYLCIPTGYALGYIFGGLVAVPLGWRAPFLLEAAAMIPFILYCAFAPAIDIRGTKDAPGPALTLISPIKIGKADTKAPATRFLDTANGFAFVLTKGCIYIFRFLTGNPTLSLVRLTIC